MNIALIETYPKDVRNQNSINLGFEIIKTICELHGKVDVFNFWELIGDYRDYDLIAINVFYLTNQLNILPFFQKNKIPVFKKDRKRFPLIIGGGAGFINYKLMKDVFDYICVGDGERFITKLLSGEKPKKEDYFLWSKEKIDSKPILRKNNAVIELTRGCKYKCKFCSYSWMNKTYREKNIELVKKQILYVKRRKIKRINFMSANFGGYSNLKELIQFCYDQNIVIINTDFRIEDYLKLEKIQINTHQKNLFGRTVKIKALSLFKVIKTGLESFSEDCRYKAGKKITDKDFLHFLDVALKYCSYIHFYLIYGLPFEDYNCWFYFIALIKRKIQKITDRKIRIEYSITNFEPTPLTPYCNEAEVNFKEKNKFLTKYIQCLTELEYINPRGKKSYGNMRGRIGRKKETYKTYMWLLKATSQDLEVLMDLNTTGVSRSLKERTYKKILKTQI